MSLTPPSLAASLPATRRYDLDWLRIGAFGLLIFYHIGMFYVSWGWHVKSAYASEAIEPLMLSVNPWRLPLLFFVSGVAIRYASDKAGAGAFSASRALRLGVPLLFGMAVAVAPQSYFELREAGLIEAGWWPFYRDYLRFEQVFPIITPTWNHLWYVAYLLVYILLLAPVLPLLRRIAERGFLGRWLGSPLRLLVLIALPSLLSGLLLAPRFPTTHALTDDWANHAASLYPLLLGYFAAKDEGFWRAVDRALPLTLVLVLLLLPTRLFANAWYPALEDALGAALRDAIWAPGRTLYLWSCILALLGLARRYLAEPSALLRYLTGGVFCYYVVHQTVIVAAGYALSRQDLPVWAEAGALIVLTVAACGLSYELFRRIPVLRVAFGIAGPRARPVEQERAAPAPVPAR
ncbi:acyltransferase family protein [Parvularcula oceani]|uniref:acyltransferase family protein n=1 Tax=Parvularcula oceani TaxID=1247963 RepID=UPI0009DDB6A3|nr:acyltransferase family protein [Parvularcula oceani]